MVTQAMKTHILVSATAGHGSRGDLLKSIPCVSVWHQKRNFLLNKFIPNLILDISNFFVIPYQEYIGQAPRSLGACPIYSWYGITKNILGKLPDFLEKRYRTMFLKMNLVIQVGFQKVMYLWISSKRWHHLGPINRSLGFHLCI